MLSDFERGVASGRNGAAPGRGPPPPAADLVDLRVRAQNERPVTLATKYKSESKGSKPRSEARPERSGRASIRS